MERLVEEEVVRPETECEKCGATVLGIVLAGVAIPLRLCPTCSNEEAAEEERRARAQAEERALDRAGATSKLRRLSLTTHPDAEAVAVAHEWLERYRRGERHNLWLYGPAGLRKTGLAWGIVRELALEAVAAYYALDEEYRPSQPKQAALFLVWRDLYDDLVRSFHASEAMDHAAVADPTRLLSVAKTVPVLCLDDLGAGRAPTPYALEQLEILVDRRYQGELPTIITSNAPSARELAARLGHEDKIAGERIVSRLLEDALRREFHGTNVRRPAAT